MATVEANRAHRRTSLYFDALGGGPASARRQDVSVQAVIHSLRSDFQQIHTLRRTHITLFQSVEGSLRDAQAQLGHSKMSTTLEIYTLPIPEQQRTTVEKLSVLMAHDGKLDQNPERLPLTSQQIQ